MSVFRADLHIHSRFSRATSRKLTLPHLAAWAGAKGIDVLATGDFTHPVWRDELRAALVLDEASALYRLRQPLGPDDVAREIPGLTGLGPAEPLFMLEAEISSIYKKNGAVRKVHSLVYVPDFAAADKLCTRLDKIGNLKSDGRPILGLDVRHLLELVLEIPRAYMIPAHIWTPWFSLFGSRSGFNSLQECFEDLTPHIFALETGLSSDPDMNRCWSQLDGLNMVSNSDAHSGENLAREATLFTGAPGYDRIFDALRGKTPDYAGTLEFFPDEGKYHLDGHRDCKVVLEPEECRRLKDICPVCGKPLTVGVLHRVLELADRQSPPEPGANFRSLVPLAEILGELFDCGPKTKKPQLKLAELTHRFGPELTLLLDTPVADVGRYWAELGEALRRMRAGQVIRQGGYDGEYGVIRLFEKNELGPALLLHASPARKKPLPAKTDWPTLQTGGPVCAVRVEPGTSGPMPPMFAAPVQSFASTGFTPSQQCALEAGPYPVLVMAGPGSGKTRTLVGRIARLLGQGVPANQIVAITFTRRAAAELRERLAARLGRKVDSQDVPEADTLHALALKYWPGPAPVVLTEEAARRAFGKANPGLDGKQADAFWDRMSLGREIMCLPDDVLVYAAAYQTWKQERGLADYTDLPETWLSVLQAGQHAPWQHVMVDEVQDLSPLQRMLIQDLLPESGAGFFGIGDPDQSIYGFRGADAHISATLGVAWPTMHVLSLTESHRAPQAILDAGRSALGRRAACAVLTSIAGRPATLQWMQSPTAEREAMWMADRVAYLVGGTSHQQADIRQELAGCHLASGSCSPGEIAVLVRLKALMVPLRMALERRGIPCAVPEAEAFWADARVDALLRGAAFFARGTETDLDETGVHAPAEAWRAGPAAVLAAVRQVALVKPETVFDPMFEESVAFRKLISAFRDAGNNWQDLLDFVSLRQELDMVKSRAEQVQIMTMHAAKGLEFKVVMLPCLDNGLLPFHGVEPLLKPGGAGYAAGTDGEDEAILEEERRLLYVGLTRASEAVFASSAAQRTLYGHSLQLLPSPLLPLQHFQGVHLIRHAKVSASQLSFFS